MEIKVILYILVLSVIMCVRANDQCEDINCDASNGSICNDKGVCDCGKCTCDAYYSGPTCEECKTCPDSCSVFKGCVGCRIFSTGNIGFMECLDKCDSIANYIPVEKADFDAATDDGLKLCKYFNEKNCMEYFKIGGMTGGYRDLYVRTEMNCDVPIPTTTTTLSVIEIGTVENKDEKHGGGYMSGDKEDAAVASGSGEIKSNSKNNAVAVTLGNSSVLLIVMSTVLSVFQGI